MNKLLCCAIVLGALLLVGCAVKKPVEILDGPVTGGTTDYTNPKAQKEIHSKEMVSFSTHFYIEPRYACDYKKTGMYDISIWDDEEGRHVLTVSGAVNHELVVEDQVLQDIQDIIDRYELVKKNGAGKVTAGLPEEYAPWSLQVMYASGEQLSFYETGSPMADWTAAIRDYVVELLTEAGYEDVLPAKEDRTIEKFSTSFDRDGQSHSYGTILMQNEERYFYHFCYDLEHPEEEIEEYAEITDELYEGLEQVIWNTGMEALHAAGTVHFDLQPSSEGFLEIYVDYESGRQIYAEYAAADIPEEWPEMRSTLMDYMDTYIQEHRVQMEEE